MSSISRKIKRRISGRPTAIMKQRRGSRRAKHFRQQPIVITKSVGETPAEIE